MDDKNNQNNIVKPEQVDLNNVRVNENDTMLNRERVNIVSATIQANAAIDEKKALKVNDQIKVKKMNPILRALIIIVLLLGACFISYLALKLVKDTFEEDNKVITTTKTTATALTKVKNYLNKSDSLRKFQDEHNILILSPKGFDLVSGENYYLLINYDESGLKTSSYGTYSLYEDELKLNTLDAGEVKYKITEDGILLNGAILKIFDSEMKYYSGKDKVKTELLIINGTLKSEYAMYITSDGKDTNVITSSYIEDAEKISLNNGLVFNKKEDKITGKNFKLSLGV